MNSYYPFKKQEFSPNMISVCSMYYIASNSSPDVYFGGDLLLSVQSVTDFTELLKHNAMILILEVVKLPILLQNTSSSCIQMSGLLILAT